MGRKLKLSLCFLEINRIRDEQLIILNSEEEVKGWDDLWAVKYQILIKEHKCHHVEEDICSVGNVCVCAIVKSICIIATIPVTY